MGWLLRGRRRIERDIPAAIAAFAFVRIEEMIPCHENRLGMPGKEKIEKDNWNNDRHDERPDRPIEKDLEDNVERETEKRGDAVVDRPDRKQKISRFAVIGVAAAGTAVQRGEPVVQIARAKDRGKHRRLAADWANQLQGPCKI